MLSCLCLGESGELPAGEAGTSDQGSGDIPASLLPGDSWLLQCLLLAFFFLNLIRIHTHLIQNLENNINKKEIKHSDSHC